MRFTVCLSRLLSEALVQSPPAASSVESKEPAKLKELLKDKCESQSVSLKKRMLAAPIQGRIVHILRSVVTYGTSRDRRSSKCRLKGQRNVSRFPALSHDRSSLEETEGPGTVGRS
ncbi:hypothetical protein RRG08_039048 [Elysia crispata]|uniref:Uncharacterized protein n=1 Tax=Elysia crispata TaxID=231223 RepID=A0AAE0XEK0_9GAST|nr:hypothetical protein RRG08_039048 [Elysia crispata]